MGQVMEQLMVDLMELPMVYLKVSLFERQLKVELKRNKRKHKG